MRNLPDPWLDDLKRSRNYAGLLHPALFVTPPVPLSDLPEKWREDIGNHPEWAEYLSPHLREDPENAFRVAFSCDDQGNAEELYVGAGAGVLDLRASGTNRR
jgi:hypothetical protein